RSHRPAGCAPGGLRAAGRAAGHHGRRGAGRGAPGQEVAGRRRAVGAAPRDGPGPGRRPGPARRGGRRRPGAAAMDKRLLVVNGPNLNLLGTREPEVYGRTTLADIEAMVRRRADELGCEVTCFQSNSEGAILDFVQREAATASGMVINPG